MERNEAIGIVRNHLPHSNFKVLREALETLIPELKEPESERIRKEIIAYLDVQDAISDRQDHDFKNWIAWLEKQKEPEDKGEISDGYHTFNELYRYRMLYNAAFFNLLPKQLVHKSKRHHDGEECFGGGWFIVMANLPTGQISNHYELKDWDLFQIPEKEVADEWDGHTPQEAAERLHEYLLEKQGQPVDSLDTKEGISLTITQDQMDDWLKKYVDAGKQYEQKDPCKDCPYPNLNCHNFPCIKKKAFDLGKSVFECVKTEYEKMEQKPQRVISAEAKEAPFNYTNILSAEEHANLENLINKLAVSGIEQYNTQAATILFNNRYSLNNYETDKT